MIQFATQTAQLPVPGNANDFIEQQLDIRITALETVLTADLV